MPKEYKKPPLGLTPKHISEIIRRREIQEAVNRYFEAELPIPVEWLEEYNEITGKGGEVVAKEDPYKRLSLKVMKAFLSKHVTNIDISGVWGLLIQPLENKDYTGLTLHDFKRSYLCSCGGLITYYPAEIATFTTSDRIVKVVSCPDCQRLYIDYKDKPKQENSGQPVINNIESPTVRKECKPNNTIEVPIGVKISGKCKPDAIKELSEDYYSEALLKFNLNNDNHKLTGDQIDILTIQLDSHNVLKGNSVITHDDYFQVLVNFNNHS